MGCFFRSGIFFGIVKSKIGEIFFPFWLISSGWNYLLLVAKCFGFFVGWADANVKALKDLWTWEEVRHMPGWEMMVPATRIVWFRRCKATLTQVPPAATTICQHNFMIWSYWRWNSTDAWWYSQVIGILFSNFFRFHYSTSMTSQPICRRLN